ncbi:MAG TPA: hypothetical protein VI386_32600 [Candidatus Sulfotelmatobacter sp.]
MQSLTLPLLVVAACLGFVSAQTGTHPAYVHALDNLRAARACLSRVSPSGRVVNQEQNAIAEIDKAIWEIKNAALGDRKHDAKDLSDHPPVNPHERGRARLHRAEGFLDRAHDDIGREEDRTSLQGLRDRVFHHIDQAHRILRQTIAESSQD